MNYIVTFFVVVLLFALVLNAIDKIKSYKKEEKSVWMDGDSVLVKKGHLDETITEKNFMTRIQ